MDAKKSILLVDPDRQSNRAMFAALVRAGHSVTDTYRADHALEILAKRSFEAAVVDVSLARAQGADLFEQLAHDWSRPLVFAMGNFVSLADGHTAIARGGHYYLPRPLDVPRVVALLAAIQEPTTLATGADLLEYLRLLLETGKKVVVEMTDHLGCAARLYLAYGDVVHAVHNELTGEEAFRSALGFAGGTLAALPWTEPEEVSIRKPRSSLLNEAAEAIARAKEPALTHQI
ncbi:MAG: response regulator [Desulfomonile tiedjei]|nr:response regulator [Desulfomonile tiedjei]